MRQSFRLTVLAPTNIIEIFERCGTVDKVIVIGLAVFSLVAWTVMFGKHFELKRLRLLNHSFESHLRDHRTLLDLPESFRNKRVDSRTRICSPTRSRATGARRRSARSAAKTTARARLEHAENALQRAIARQTLRYESSMIFLASIVSGAPFIGLLGTVWGVMEAFSAVATQQIRRHPAARARRFRRACSPRSPAWWWRSRRCSATICCSGNTRRMITELENLRQLAGRSHRAGIELNGTRTHPWPALSAANTRAHPIADLNVTNLIDLGFMLLIIFMIATPLIQQEQKIAVDLPVESAAPQQKPDPKDRFETITLKADGMVLIHGQPIAIRALSAEFERFAAEPRPPIIQLRCDARATAQQIISVMEQLRKHDLTKIVFPTEVER